MQSHTLLLTSLFTAVAFSASAQGTAFSYQGQLQNNGSPASGTYNLTFSLFNTNTSGVPVAGPVTNNAVAVTNGLFTVLIDFGPGAFTGQTNWLGIAVETNGVNTFTTLAPRQQLTPVPYAIYAESASGLSGTLSASQLTSIGNTNSGQGNFFVGPSGNSVMSGSYNTANGDYALSANGSGAYNTANGFGALSYNTSGSFNTANGLAALVYNTSGWYNTADGDGALYNNTSGNNNTANGFEALYNNTSGSLNTASGNNALLANTTGSYNTANGSGALYDNTNGWYNTANGDNALYNNTSGNNNTANGFVALYYNTDGSYNTANGFDALYYNTNGSDNTANGYQALYSNTNGGQNTANGSWALAYNTSGSDNIALGYQAGYNFTGSESGNIDIGNPGVTGENNTIRIGTSQTATYLSGTVYATSFSSTSDRNAKENFTVVNPREVLAKVASLPVTEWNYKTDSKDVQHIGPMAQDFQAAFRLNGTDDKHISVVDEGGVALAAIQGLNQKLNEKDTEIQDLKRQNDSLAKQLNHLESVVESLADRK